MTTPTLNGTSRPKVRTRRPRRRAVTAPTVAANHPLANREIRTALNYAFKAKGVPVKVCSRCLVVRSVESFGVYSSSSDGRKSYCRDCQGAWHAARQATDPAYRAERAARAAAWTAENHEAKMAYQEAYKSVVRAENVAQNADRVQDPNVLKRCAGQCGQVLPETEFRLDRGQKDGLRRRCRHCADATVRARRACEEAFGDPAGQPCYLCGELISVASEAWVDHAIPQSQGGPDTADNVRWTHGSCNARRHTKPLTPDQLYRLQATATTILPGEVQ